MRFTVFTPTYNRSHTLPRLYESIRRQTIRDFEWVIVDDGSTDGTDELVQQWQQEWNDFPIRYFWQPNQHKKVAFNRGVREAKGQWFVPIDSDDELLPDTLEQFAKMWATIPSSNTHRYAGVVGLCLDDYGKIVGDRFPEEPFDATSVELWFDYKIDGEKFGCMRTEVLRLFPFPEDISNLVPENIVWFRISKHYISRCFNIPVRIYHSDSESITRPRDPLIARKTNAEGALLYYAEALDWINFRRLFRSPERCLFLAIQYNRFKMYLPMRKRRFKPKRVGAYLLSYLIWPLGVVLYLSDRSHLTTHLKNLLQTLSRF